MHDASQYRQIAVMITLGAKHHLVTVMTVSKLRRLEAARTTVLRVAVAVEPTDTGPDVVRAAALALLEAADRL